ncbi:hypothetical protein RBSWK_06604 [Rhodopirellula baltica SWK14]|uniref:Uncharacterized protein n=1 Tax=Rhodopirellula baltica SWK14 TaxID=993516 RepID=L7C783_RHOBT|nr:hypothetical protein RBSWK_06604 [Rhodopirellula baltica SWK14]
MKLRFHHRWLGQIESLQVPHQKQSPLLLIATDRIHFRREPDDSISND